jgi:hypothetical protein
VAPTSPGFDLTSISVEARHADAQGSAQTFSSLLNVRLYRGTVTSDPNSIVFSSSSQRTYSAGSTAYQTVTFDLSSLASGLEPNNAYVMFVTMNEMEGASAYASFDGLTLEGTLVPEPSAAALLGLGLAGLAALRRR